MSILLIKQHMNIIDLNSKSLVLKQIRFSFKGVRKYRSSLTKFVCWYIAKFVKWDSLTFQFSGLIYTLNLTHRNIF